MYHDFCKRNVAAASDPVPALWFNAAVICGAEPMGWKKLESRTVYDNPWITVMEDSVINPGGGRNEYGHVHFKNRAVAIVPVDEAGNTWLVGQQRYTLGEYSWELPMGGAPVDEDPLDAAKRELKEETGLSAGQWHTLMRMHTSNSITDEVALVYIARQLTEGETRFEETEDLSIRKLPLAEAVEMARDGRITDAVCVAALLRVNELEGMSGLRTPSRR